MKLTFGNKALILFVVIFAVFIGLNCLSAADVDNSNNFTLASPDNSSSSNAELNYNSIDLPGGHNLIPEKVDEDCFVMTVRGASASTGYHWIIGSETHGVDLVSEKHVLDDPNPLLFGSARTDYFTFHINSDDYYVKLLLVTPAGNIVEEVDSNMIN